MAQGPHGMLWHPQAARWPPYSTGLNASMLRALWEMLTGWWRRENSAGGPCLESIYGIETKQKALLFPKSTVHLAADQLPRVWPVLYTVFLDTAVAPLL